jgi:hypothetical protein
MNIYIERHLGCLRHFGKIPHTKKMVYGFVENISAFSNWKICRIGKNMGGFVKVDFFDKKRFVQFAPPS